MTKVQFGALDEALVDEYSAYGAVYPDRANLGFMGVARTKGTTVHLGVVDEARKKLEKDVPKILKALGGADRGQMGNLKSWGLTCRRDGVGVHVTQELRGLKASAEDAEAVRKAAAKLGYAAEIRWEEE